MFDVNSARIVNVSVQWSSSFRVQFEECFVLFDTPSDTSWRNNLLSFNFDYQRRERKEVVLIILEKSTWLKPNSEQDEVPSAFGEAAAVSGYPEYPISFVSVCNAASQS